MTATLLVIVLTLWIIPWLWCGGISAFQHICQRQPSSDVAEKRTLVLMLLAPLSGVIALLIHHIWPLPAGFDVGPLTTPMALTPSPGLDMVLFLLLAVYAAEVIRRSMALRRVARQFNAIAQQAIASGEAHGYRITSENVSPFVSLAGAIVLPQNLFSQLSDAQRDLILAHERAHVQRRDPAYFLAMAWLAQIGWCNPFLRRQLQRCRLAAELACDDEVIRQHEQQRRRYAETLVAVLRLFHHATPSCCATVISTTDQGDAAMRIKQIMMNTTPSTRSTTRPLYWLTLVMVLPLLAVQLVFSAPPQDHEANRAAAVPVVAPEPAADKAAGLLVEARERQERHRLHNQQEFMSKLFTVDNIPAPFSAMNNKKDEC